MEVIMNTILAKRIFSIYEILMNKFRRIDEPFLIIPELYFRNTTCVDHNELIRWLELLEEEEFIQIKSRFTAEMPEGYSDTIKIEPVEMKGHYEKNKTYIDNAFVSSNSFLVHVYEIQFTLMGISYFEDMRDTAKNL